MDVGDADLAGFERRIDANSRDDVTERGRVVVDAEDVGVAAAVGVADTGGAVGADLGGAGELGLEHGVLVAGHGDGERHRGDSDDTGTDRGNDRGVT